MDNPRDMQNHEIIAELAELHQTGHPDAARDEALQAELARRAERAGYRMARLQAATQALEDAGEDMCRAAIQALREGDPKSLWLHHALGAYSVAREAYDAAKKALR